jgi:PAS domain S-box-containing protein
MGVLDEETRIRITKLLKRHPKGLMISDLASRLKINRNVMAKYLEILLISGEVEMDLRGNAKLFTLSRRVPVNTLFENTSDYMIMLDSSGRILRVNSPVLTLLGIKAGEITGRKCMEIDHPLFVALPCSENPEAAENTRDISCVINGKTRYFRVKQTPLVLADGSRGSVLVCEDITAEMQSRELLELSEARFRAIIEDQAEFIIRFLPGGNLTFVNGSWARFLEKNTGELKGTYGLPAVTDVDRHILEEQIQSLNRNEPVTTGEFRVMDRHGKSHWQQWTFRALFNGNGVITEYQGVGRDISGRFEVEAVAGRHAADVEFLSIKGRELLHVPPGPALYCKILQDVSELLPDALLALSTYNTGIQVMTISAARGKDLEEMFRDIFGRDLVGLTFHVSDPTVLEILMSGEFHTIYGGLYPGFFCQVPFEACKKMEEAMNMGNMYAFGFTSPDILLGNIAIVLRKGQVLPQNSPLDAYLRQASLAMAWKSAESSRNLDLNSKSSEIPWSSAKILSENLNKIRGPGT